MGNGIVLRVQEGLKVSPELKATLETLLPGYQEERYTEKPNYQQSMKRRMDSLHNAFLFILEAHPPKKCTFSLETLKDYALECKLACNMNKISVDELHNELEKYTANLVEVLSLCYAWPTKEAVALLNEAEQYMLMNKGRPDLATLIPMNLGKGLEYVLQFDESIAPYYDKLVQEMQEIKGQGYPKSNAIFHAHSINHEYQKIYFIELDSKITNNQEVIQDLETFIKLWIKEKPKSDELKRIAQRTSPFASWFNELSPHLQAMVTVLSVEPLHSIEDKLKNFVTILKEKNKLQPSNQLVKLAKIPEWYCALSDMQQIFLEHVLKNSPSIEEALSFVSSRHRTLPLPANFAKHSLYRIDCQGNVQQLGSKRFRSSHIASRDVLNCSYSVQLRHSSSNFEKVTEEAKSGQPVILQTLISPVSQLNYITKIIDFDLPPDCQLYDKGREAVAQSKRYKDTIQTNHPYNMAKRVIYTAAANEYSAHLKRVAEQYSQNNPALRELLDDYDSVLNSYLGSATFWDYDGRELFLSSLEQLIIITINGHSYGSCVSGKDRKAIELIHTDAMMLYKEKYGQFPKFGDPKDKKERIAFVDMVMRLYTSRHQHEHAGQNAPGSEGIKTPANYFPPDIVEAINKRLETDKGLKYDDRLATDNEVKNISKKLPSYFSEKNQLLCQLKSRQLELCQSRAKQLGTRCTELYTTLFHLINEKQLFISSMPVIISTSSTLGGLFGGSKNESRDVIEEIRKLMVAETGDSIARMAKIFAIVTEHPESKSISPATQSVYCRISELLNIGEKSLNASLDQTIKEWTSLFKESKESKIVTNSSVLSI